MKANELITRYTMENHPENGIFIERHYPATSSERPESGSIYYYVAPGEIFASRLPKDAPDRTFITCITVPRFTYEGFEMFTRAQMMEMCQEVEDFWEE